MSAATSGPSHDDPLSVISNSANMSASCPSGMSSEKSGATVAGRADPRHAPNQTARTYSSAGSRNPTVSLKNPTHPHRGSTASRHRFSTNTDLELHPVCCGT